MRRGPSARLRGRESKPASNRLLLPLCALCLYLLYLQLATSPKPAAAPAAAKGGSAALSVVVSRAPARPAAGRKAAAGRSDPSIRGGLASADAAAAALVAELKAGRGGGARPVEAAAATATTTTTNKPPATADAAAQAAGVGSIGGGAVSFQPQPQAAARPRPPLNPVLQPGALAQRDPARPVPAAEVAANIIAAAARSAAAANNEAAAAAAAKTPLTKPDAAAQPHPAADARPALAHDPAVQPLAEPASAAVAAELDFLRATLRDPVDPVPPAGSGTSSDEARRLAVRAAMAHAWAGYVAHAWGQDEVAPVTRHGYQTFCSLAATLIDSLDTLHIMGFKAEFARAREWVATSLKFTADCGLSVFESTIRVVGGLLAAHDASGDRVFIDKAEEAAQALAPAYATPLGFPRSEVHLASSAARTPGWVGGGQSALLAEIGTVQMELLSLAAATGNATYAAMAENIVAKLRNAHPDGGVLPIYVSLADASAYGQLTIGAMADSYYEYLLKVWLLKRKTKAEGYRAMWERAMDDVLDRFVHTSDVGGHVYVGEIVGDAPVARMEHLTCFVAGNLALGVMEGAVTGAKAARYMDAAKGITETCYQMYKQMPTGLAPEYVRFNPGQPMTAAENAPYNLLRPEAVEAIFMLWRATGDVKYREWGWDIFQAFEKHCKIATGGYSGLQDVRQVPPVHNDKQESFWLAETLKYLYLLFSPPDAFPLTGDDGWVLNTEAHPLRKLPPTAIAALTMNFEAPEVVAKPAVPAGVQAAAATVPQAAGGAAAAATVPQAVPQQAAGLGTGPKLVQQPGAAALDGGVAAAVGRAA